MFNKLNSMGQAVGKPTESPTSRIGQNNQRQVSVIFGHGNEGGKVYTYLAGNGIKAGDLVTPEVTHHKSGKDYKTLAKVMSTRDALSGASGDTTAHLSEQGVMLKTIGETNQRSLPSFKAQKETNPKFTAKKWEEKSASDYHEKTMKRLNSMGEVK